MEGRITKGEAVKQGGKQARKHPSQVGASGCGEKSRRDAGSTNGRFPASNRTTGYPCLSGRHASDAKRLGMTSKENAKKVGNAHVGVDGERPRPCKAGKSYKGKDEN
jgi:hypothetical protein